MAFENFPYSNFHDMNLDWILGRVKALDSRMNEFVTVNTIKHADPLLWSIAQQYEQNTLVQNSLGETFLSKRPVPTGISLENGEYWLKVADFQGAADQIKSQIAPDEGAGTTATAPRAINDMVWIKDFLYRITAPMIAGDSYVDGSNCEKLTVDGFLKLLRAEITATEGDITEINTEIESLSERVEAIELKPTGYDTAIKMIQDMAIREDSIVKTFGFYEPGDGGESYYMISGTQIPGISVSLNNGLYAAAIPTNMGVNVVALGGVSPENSNDVNRQRIQSFIDASYYPQLIIPGTINYGYDRHGTSLKLLDFSNCSIKCMVWDYSVDESYHTEDSRVAMQLRLWSNTPDPSNIMQHDGNTILLHANHHPSMIFSVDDKEGFNNPYRASIFFGKNATNLWQIGQSVNAGDLKLGITRYNAENEPHTAVCLAIDHEDGKMSIGNKTTTPYGLGIYDRYPVVINQNGELFLIKDKDSNPTINIGGQATANGELKLSHAGGAKKIINLANGTETYITPSGNIVIRHNQNSGFTVSDVGAVNDIMKLKTSGYFRWGVSGGAWPSNNRPSSHVTPENGAMIFDTTLGKPLWYKTGTGWVDATGFPV